MRRQVVAAAVFLLITGCVLEERTDCPCYLTLNLDSAIRDGAYTEAVMTLSPCADGSTCRELIDMSAYEGAGYEKKVMRDKVSVSVVCGFKSSVFDEDSFHIPENTQADPIMAYAENLFCDEETETADVILHKQYCRITFVHDSAWAGEDFPCRLRVHAECNGMMLDNLAPVRGDYVADATAGSDGRLSLTLPRQMRNDMGLDIVDLDGEVVYSIDLGKAFSSASYDWGKEDLDDVRIKIDYSNAEVEIEIIQWEKYYETVDI